MTGLGCISPVGLNTRQTWDAFLAGKNGIGPVTRFDASDLPVQIAGEATGFEPLDRLPAKEVVSKAIFAHAVEMKGADEDGYATARLVDDIHWLGYTKMLLKTDNEPAIVKVLKDTLVTTRVEVPEVEQIA